MLTVDDTSVIRAYSDELSSEVKVRLALESWRRCLLLRPAAPSPEDPSLLVMPTKLNDGTLDCRYIGAVLEDPASEKDESYCLVAWRSLGIRMGRLDNDSFVSELEVTRMAHGKELKACKRCSAENNFADDGDEEVEGEKIDISGTPAWCTEDGITTYTDYCVTTAKEPSGTKGEEVITQEELKGALREGKHRAIHYLVNKSVQPSSEELATLMEETAGTTVRSIYGQWSFGDAYVATSQLDEAIQLHKATLESAMNLFENERDCLLEGSPNVTKSPKYAYYHNRRRPAPILEVADTDWRTTQEGWNYIWWNALAGSILLYSAEGSEEGCQKSREYKSLAYNTIVRISDEDNKGEGGNFLKMENDATAETTIDRPESTDRILDILVKALRKFEVMFHRDHLLVFMTAQNLGKRLRAHGRWAEARAKLERAVKGFEAHLRVWRDFHDGKAHWLDERARKALGAVEDRI
ncbi:hypothetical protein F4860DRAFT_520445 [Xylaria cubensis]|nr:hypothetical protein F4860DRAFT_520445 [Xylaria cubensis]